MTGLVPAFHVVPSYPKDVNARAKPAHDKRKDNADSGGHHEMARTHPQQCLHRPGQLDVLERH